MDLSKHPSGQKERDLFIQALDKATASERAAYLEAACGNDTALRRRMELLLERSEKVDTFLEKPVLSISTANRDAISPAAESAAATVPASPASEQAGDLIGRYKILQKIGEGGCGVVYMAEQEEPVRRRVALKVIKLGMDTKSVIARFEAERQALALMDHPNIAKVLEAGATDAGRPYFVMELVRGVKITEYCDEAKLSTRDRLDLFIKVCQAIQHAHQKGIIHRDIKPSNILVTLHDGVPVPKVIDFGIAKATTDQRLTDKTLFTALEQFIGTPAYMSPEQAEMSGLDIDTRCDIYSLGVLLYEMLAGSTPFDAKELMASGIDAMRKTIREKEPLRPSTKLSQTLVAADVRRRTSGVTGESASSRRRLQEQIHQLQGDLDWIVMKCLEKDRARRYETANGLASDIQRHLNDEAVLARPASAAYRFQKLVRRNKLAFAAASAVALTLIAGMSFSTWAFLREAAQRRTAVEEQRKAEAAQASEKVQRKLADLQLALQAWEEGDLQRANDLIDANRPAPGQTPGFEWRYLRKLCQDQSYKTFGGPNHQLRSARFFDSDLLLLNDEKKLILHDLSGGKDQVLLEDQDGILHPSFCSRNTNLLATVTDDGRIKVWDLAAGRVRLEFEGHPHSAINSVALSRDGKWMASASSDRSVKLWDVESGNPKAFRTLHHYSRVAYGVAFSIDGRQLYSSGSEGVIRVWDVASGAEAASPLDGHTGTVVTLATSPDGLQMASGSVDSTVVVWDLISHKLLTRLFGHSSGVFALAFSPDGRMLASGGVDQSIRLWDLNHENQPELLRGHGAFLRSFGFSPDGGRIVSRSDDGLVKLWHANLQDNALVGRREVLNDVALSPDGRLLASVADQSFTVNLWDLHTRSQIVLTGHTNSVHCAAFSPDGRILATGSHDRTVKLWDVNDRKTLATLTNGFPVGSLAFSPDGRTLAVGGSWLNFMLLDGSGGLQFWDVPSQQAIRTIPGGASDIMQVAWSDDGSLLATGHNDGSVRLWDAPTRRLHHRFKSQVGSSTIMSLAFSPTEPLLVAGDWAGNMRFFNTKTMEVIPPPPKPHTFGVYDLAFSPDGRTLASYGDGGGLKLWNVATRQVALTLKGHMGWVSGIAFSRDGNLMVTSSADATVRLWPAVTVEEAIAAAKTRKDNQ